MTHPRDSLQALMRHVDHRPDPMESAAVLDEVSAILGVMPEAVIGWAQVEAALAEESSIVEFTEYQAIA